MAQRNDLAEKKRVLIDGVEFHDLVNVAEVPLESILSHMLALSQ